MTEKPKFHSSQLSMALRCMQQLEYFMKYGPKAPGSKSICGSSVHKPAQRNFEHKIEKGILLPGESVADIARDTVNEIWQEKGCRLSADERTVGEAKVRGGVIDLAVSLSLLHHWYVAPTVEPLAVEEPFVLKHPDLDCDLAGRIDLIDQRLDGLPGIRDIKTIKSKPPKGRTDKSLQFTQYAMAGWAFAGKVAVPPVAVDYLVKTKTPYALTEHTVRSKEEMLRLIARIKTVWTSIQAGIFIATDPTNWWCSEEWCGYYDTCEAR